MLNISAYMSQGEILEIAHKAIAVPTVWIMVIASTLSFWLAALIVLNPAKTNYKKIFIMWLIFTMVVGLVALFISVSPNFIQVIGESLN